MSIRIRLVNGVPYLGIALTEPKVYTNIIPNSRTFMRLIGLQRLFGLLGHEATTDIWISAWVNEVKNNTWLNKEHVLNCYPLARQVSSDKFIFSVAQSGSAIHVQLCFERRIAIVTSVKKNYE